MKRMLSGIKPSGKLTLANYIGAIKHFVNYQDTFEMYVFIANLHAITVPQDKLELRNNIRNLAGLYIACGLDPQKVTLFVQTDILEHANLAFIFNGIAYMGELARMTQFKDKTQKTEDSSVGVGLFTYPLLMAADILIYDPDFVPVGEDQKQHVELTRDIGVRFNQRFGDTFKIPEPLIPTSGARIMSLSNPLKKMSKSDDDNDRGCIYLLDDIAVAKKKIMSAVTDSDTTVRYDVATKPGISNLLTILSSLTNESVDSIVERFEGKSYSEFKSEVANAVATILETIQSKFKTIMEGDLLDKTLFEGAEKARAYASKKLRKVEERMGLRIK